MEKKQTAVEYLVEQLIKKGFFKRLPIIEIQQAKQMEKEMEAENCQRQWIKESNPGLFNSPYAIEPTPKITREEVWINAWCVVANAINCETSETATKWADKCLIEFDKRFTNKIMTPKEKAEELVDTFRMNVLDYEGCSINTHKAKQCALIAVDEIYKLRMTHGQHLDFDLDKINYYSYWQEVKQEIEKL